MLLRAVAAAFLGLLAHVPHAAAQSGKKTSPPAGLQKEFDEFIARFRAALKGNDAAAVTAMTRLPFHHNNADLDAAQFRGKAYPVHFTARTRSCLQSTRGVYDRDGENNHNYFIFCGQQIFVFTKTPAGFLFTEVGVND
jgi:hypothetical protein